MLRSKLIKASSQVCVCIPGATWPLPLIPADPVTLQHCFQVTTPLNIIHRFQLGHPLTPPLSKYTNSETGLTISGIQCRCLQVLYACRAAWLEHAQVPLISQSSAQLEGYVEPRTRTRQVPITGLYQNRSSCWLMGNYGLHEVSKLHVEHCMAAEKIGQALKIITIFLQVLSHLRMSK